MLKLGIMNLRLSRRIVRQFHDVIKVTGLVIAPDLKNVQLAFVRAGNRLELLDAFELAHKRPVLLEAFPIDNLHGPVAAQSRARQPDFAITALANAANQFVIRDVRQSRSPRSGAAWMRWGNLAGRRVKRRISSPALRRI